MSVRWTSSQVTASPLKMDCDNGRCPPRNDENNELTF